MRPTLFALLVGSFLLFGCTQLQNRADAVLAAKSTESIQLFLDEHPNAKIVTQYQTAEQMEKTLKDYPDCSNVKAQPGYFISFKEQVNQDELSAVAFISLDQIPLCSVILQKRSNKACPVFDLRACDGASQPGGLDANGCPLPPKCIPESYQCESLGGRCTTSCSTGEKELNNGICPQHPYLDYETICCGVQKPQDSCESLGGVCLDQGDPVKGGQVWATCSNGGQPIKGGKCSGNYHAPICCSVPKECVDDSQCPAGWGCVLTTGGGPSYCESIPVTTCAKEGEYITGNNECCEGLEPYLPSPQAASPPVCTKPTGTTPKITFLSPSSATYGEEVTIMGSGFNSEPGFHNVIQLNGVGVGSAKSLDGKTIMFSIPDGSPIAGCYPDKKCVSPWEPILGPRGKIKPGDYRLTVWTNKGVSNALTLTIRDAFCVSEGESLGPVIPGNKAQCCSGLEPYVPEGLVGTRGTCIERIEPLPDLFISLEERGFDGRIYQRYVVSNGELTLEGSFKNMSRKLYPVEIRDLAYIVSTDIFSKPEINSRCYDCISYDGRIKLNGRIRELKGSDYESLGDLIYLLQQVYSYVEVSPTPVPRGCVMEGQDLSDVDELACCPGLTAKLLPGHIGGTCLKLQATPAPAPGSCEFLGGTCQAPNDAVPPEGVFNPCSNGGQKLSASCPNDAEGFASICCSAPPSKTCESAGGSCGTPFNGPLTDGSYNPCLSGGKVTSGWCPLEQNIVEQVCCVKPSNPTVDTRQLTLWALYGPINPDTRSSSHYVQIYSSNFNGYSFDYGGGRKSNYIVFVIDTNAADKTKQGEVYYADPKRNNLLVPAPLHPKAVVGVDGTIWTNYVDYEYSPGRKVLIKFQSRENLISIPYSDTDTSAYYEMKYGNTYNPGIGPWELKRAGP